MSAESERLEAEEVSSTERPFIPDSEAGDVRAKGMSPNRTAPP